MPILNPEQLAKLSEISNPLVRQRFSVLYQLPQDLQESMFSEQTSGSIWRITKEKYNLTDSKVSAVARVIGLIFLGEMPIKNFIVELKNALGVDVPTAQAIAQDINQAIFQPVRESLMKVHNITENSKLQNTNYKQIPNIQIQNNQNFRPEPRRPQANTDYEVQQRKDEVLNKIRTPQPPPLRPGSAGQATARPASYVKLRNTVDLRHGKRKNGRYNGFFT